METSARQKKKKKKKNTCKIYWVIAFSYIGHDFKSGLGKDYELPCSYIRDQFTNWKEKKIDNKKLKLMLFDNLENYNQVFKI